MMYDFATDLMSWMGQKPGSTPVKLSSCSVALLALIDRSGVPITTPNGLRIGAYCVLGDKPRKGFSDKHVKFMLDMGETIMAHLESLRMRTEVCSKWTAIRYLGMFLLTRRSLGEVQECLLDLGE